MSAKALLDAQPRPTEAQIRAALECNLCRCGTHTRILKAIRAAAEGGAR
jgi:nicotinate dehydrogenase subunit A